MYQATTTHARQRIAERANTDSRRMRTDMREAIKQKNYVAIKDPTHEGRVIAYFSSNFSYLWKVVLSKEGSIITVLPPKSKDFEFAIQQGIIKDRSEDCCECGTPYSKWVYHNSHNTWECPGCGRTVDADEIE